MNHFAAAAKIEAPKPKAAKSKTDRVSISGMLALASMDVVIKSLTGAKKTMEATVKARMQNHFITEGMAAKKRPDNFTGFEGNAEASCQLKVRGGNSPLKAEEIEILKKHKIPFATEDKVTECFVINPAYTENQELLARVSEALAGVEGLPADFIQKQEQKAYHSTDESLDAVFKLEDREIVTELLPLVAGQSIKATLTGDDSTPLAFKLVDALMNPTGKKDKKAKAA